MRAQLASARREVIVIALCAVAAAVVEAWMYFRVHGILVDFRAFWCAGSVLNHGGDPYLASSMVRCEYADPAFRPYPLVSIPAPLPGYALLLFAALAQLPYVWAATLWSIILAAATILCVILCAKLSGRSVILCSAAFVLPAVILWLPVGEIVPLVLAGALIAACAMRTGRTVLMIVGLAVLALEPHLALGVWIGVALYDRRNIVPIIGLGSLLFALWIVGAHASPVAYFKTVLPLHAYSELPRDNQFSLSWIAFALGASQRFALAAGAASYGLSICAGLYVGRIVSRTPRDPFPMIATMLFAGVTGGAFIHDTQTAAAIPAALLFSDAALVGLCIPWLLISRDPLLIPIAAANAFVVSRKVRIPRATPLAIWCCATTLMFIFYVLRIRNLTPPVPLAFPFPNSELASGPWGAYTWAHIADFRTVAWAVKIPTWAGLVLLWIAAAASARRTRLGIVKSAQALPPIPIQSVVAESTK